MKKLLASLLAILITAAGYTIVDQTLVDRVDFLEQRVSYLESLHADDLQPDVTYLDKFVISILESGSYTAQTEMIADGLSVPITYYVKGDNSAVEMTIGSMMASQLDLPEWLASVGKIRFITKDKSTDPKVYIAFPSGYAELETEDMDEVRDMLREADAAQDIRSMLSLDSLTYVGLESYSGFVVESWKMNDEQGYRFYFDTRGLALARIEIVDLTTDTVTETVLIQLFAGASEDAFKLSGKKYTMEELEKLLGGSK